MLERNLTFNWPTYLTANSNSLSRMCDTMNEKVATGADHFFLPFHRVVKHVHRALPTRTTFLPPFVSLKRWLNYLVVLKLLQVLCQFGLDQQHRRNGRHLFCIPVLVSGDGVPLTHLLLLSFWYSELDPRCWFWPASKSPFYSRNSRQAHPCCSIESEIAAKPLFTCI